MSARHRDGHLVEPEVLRPVAHGSPGPHGASMGAWLTGSQTAECPSGGARLGRPAPRPALDGDLDCDVCIVGGGLTGLWTAYWLASARPVARHRRAGGGVRRLRRVRPQRRLAVGRALRQQGPTTPATHGRAAVSRRSSPRWSGRRRGHRRLPGAKASTPTSSRSACCTSPGRRPSSSGCATARRRRAVGHRRAATSASSTPPRRQRGSTSPARSARCSSPHAARVQPAKLVRGLADGGRAARRPDPRATRVTRIEPGVGDDRPRHGAGAGRAALPGGLHRRASAATAATWLPMNSAMIVTEPLPDDAWDDDRLGGCRAARRQRARLLLRPAHRRRPDRARRARHPLPLRIAHRRPRAHPGRGRSSRCADPARALPGVARRPDRPGLVRRARRAARLVRERDVRPATGLGQRRRLRRQRAHRDPPRRADPRRPGARPRHRPRTDLPWVGRRVRRWEPEPLRWLGVKAMYGLYRAADRREDAGLARPSRLARLGDRLTGR